VATLIDGTKLAGAIRADVARKVAERVGRGLRPPGLVTILVGDDDASKVYVGRKQRMSKEVGMLSESVELPAST
jgi:methylenetetrahydrofolate dehydrogenase (NADP+)/methenyltetrahydrofolate cyclohydrolase